jgi:hypothetical protein
VSGLPDRSESERGLLRDACSWRPSRHPGRIREHARDRSVQVSWAHLKRPEGTARIADQRQSIELFTRRREERRPARSLRRRRRERAARPGSRLDPRLLPRHRRRLRAGGPPAPSRRSRRTAGHCLGGGPGLARPATSAWPTPPPRSAFRGRHRDPAELWRHAPAGAPLGASRAKELRAALRALRPRRGTSARAPHRGGRRGAAVEYALRLANRRTALPPLAVRPAKQAMTLCPRPPARPGWRWSGSRTAFSPRPMTARAGHGLHREAHCAHHGALTAAARGRPAPRRRPPGVAAQSAAQAQIPSVAPRLTKRSARSPSTKRVRPWWQITV